jgi:hypothetical protein
MWHTPCGDRNLHGAEAILIKAAITGVAEQIREESSDLFDQCEYAIELFDSLSWTQRLALLDRVATYLLTDTAQSIELSAVNEAAVAALFEHVRFEIDMEIDDDARAGTRWRQSVLAAYCESEEEPDPVHQHDDDDDLNPLPTADCDRRERWNDLIEVLMDRILWDRDYEWQDDFLDADPARVATVRQFVGVDADYFSAAAPDVTSDEQAVDLLRKLGALSSADGPL